MDVRLKKRMRGTKGDRRGSPDFSDGVMFTEHVAKTIERNRMLEPGDGIVIGCSGGPDSTGLVSVLCRLRKRYSVWVHIAHLNHMLRPGACDRDEEAVRGLAQRLAVPVTVGRRRVREFARRKKLSLEEAARNARYEFLAGVARKVGARRVAVGHTADDQAETVLLNMIRGSGPGGLSGMPAVRRMGEEDSVNPAKRRKVHPLMLIRPLLDVRRKEIEEYLRYEGLPSRVDESNRDLAFMRNRIRHELVPVLTRYNRDVVEHISRMAELLRRDEEYLSRQLQKHLAGAVRIEKPMTRVSIDIGRLQKLGPALGSRAVREAIRLVKGDLRGVGWKHWLGIAKLAESGESGSLVELPGSLGVVREYGRLVISRMGEPARRRVSHELAVPGRLVLPGHGLVIRTVALGKRPRGADLRRDRVKVFDLDAVRRPIVVRSRRPGDRFRPFGLGGTKKVKDFLSDAKVPSGERWKILLLESDGSVLWVLGLVQRNGRPVFVNRRSDAAPVTPGTKRFFKVEVRGTGIV